ncbi:hypothetical protein F511_30185 [Dorcoceras hygrometricum]|uniref:Uncharacterized protein n=1 Tax=Dorcoceras hygrometricum TaxID=472368 RepID=A0A2Z7CLH7_9LAMI|nr:hypothetical protein F511_30185 [Dorcoceras hygrometricum]
MASVLFVNALQVNFASVLTMENCVMVKMFKSLEDSGLKGFLEVSGSVYEEAVLEFFANAKVLAGTIVSLVGDRNIAITKATFIEVFGLPSEGLTNFLTIPKVTVIEMRQQFSGSDEPFKAPNKKKEMKIEFRLLHDIVAKALSTKAGSFDQVTTERLDIIIAITAGLKVNWAQILFQVLLNMVKTPKRQSQGFAFQQANEDTANNTEGGESKGCQPIKKVKPVNRNKKSTVVAEPRQKKQKVSTQTVEARIQVAPPNFDSEKSSETDSCPLVARRGKRKQVTESSDSEYTIYFPLKAFAKRRRTQKPQTQQRSADDGGNSQYDSIPTIPVEVEGLVLEKTWILLDSMNPNDKESDSLQDKPERSSANSLDTETNHSERAIVAHSGPGRQVQPNISYPELRLVASIRFWDLDWATQLLPRIAPRDNEKNIMELEVEKVYHEHLANFKLDALSVNYDYFCIQRLHKELKLAVPTPTDRSTLQFMDTTTQTLTTLSPRVSSLDLCARINDDKNLTRHHTTLLHEQLKNAADGLDIKIDVLERTLSKRMDDSHQHFTKLETTMVRNYADSHQQLVDELASVKSHLAAMVESIKEFGADKKGEGGQNRPGQGLNRTEEGSSDEQSGLQGRGSSSKRRKRSQSK